MPRYDQDAETPAQSSEADVINAKTDAMVAKNNIKIGEEHWLKAYWRPAMGWLYMVICFFDFVLFPALAMVLPAMMKSVGIDAEYQVWQSLTLANGGLVHIAFGAIVGVSAWSRGQEKITGSA